MKTIVSTPTQPTTRSSQAERLLNRAALFQRLYFLSPFFARGFSFGNVAPLGGYFKQGGWIHGGRPEDILHTITLGLTTKGMLAWEPLIGPERVREVAAYVVAQNAKALGRPLPGKDEESVEHKEGGERS